MEAVAGHVRPNIFDTKRTVQDPVQGFQPVGDQQTEATEDLRADLGKNSAIREGKRDNYSADAGDREVVGAARVVLWLEAATWTWGKDCEFKGVRAFQRRIWLTVQFFF